MLIKTALQTEQLVVALNTITFGILMYYCTRLLCKNECIMSSKRWWKVVVKGTVVASPFNRLTFKFVFDLIEPIATVPPINNAGARSSLDPLRKILLFHLISWSGNFVERHSFRRVSGKSPETLRKLCFSTKFPHQEIRWNYGILRGDQPPRTLHMTGGMTNLLFICSSFVGMTIQ